MNRSWSLRNLISEGLRNFNADWIRTLLMIIVAAISLSFVAISNSTAFDSLHIAFEKELALGSAARLVASPDMSNPQTFDGASCDRLADAPGILRAGSASGKSVVTSSTGVSFVFASVTRGFLEVVSPGFATVNGPPVAVPNLVLSHDLALELGLTAGERLQFDTGEVFYVGGIVDTVSRPAGFERAAFGVTIGTRTAVACAFETLPTMRELADSYSATLQQTRSGLITSAVYRRPDEVPSPAEGLRGGLERKLPFVVSIFLAAYWFALERPSRRALSLYRTAGCRRFDCWTLMMAKSLPVVASSVLVSGTVSIVYSIDSDLSHAGRQYGWTAGALTAGLCSSFIALLSVGSLRRREFELLKARD